MAERREDGGKRGTEYLTLAGRREDGGKRGTEYLTLATPVRV
ncbi:hypothetical protein [Cohnella lubricantis]|nr:hypothetical protein [Cohnella lubricantis]MBP2120651.1 hypothetical protein [Cohnella lubricantis]